MDNSVAYQYVDVPVLKRSHVDMNAARIHPKYGSWANSDLFVGMLARIRTRVAPQGTIRLDAVPEGILVDTSRFLAHVQWIER